MKNVESMMNELPKLHCTIFYGILLRYFLLIMYRGYMHDKMKRVYKSAV